MSEDEPKSAVELAMEKLRARGDFAETPLTDAQKAEIADTRSLYRAKIAELEETIRLVAEQFGADVSDILNEEAE